MKKPSSKLKDILLHELDIVVYMKAGERPSQTFNRQMQKVFKIVHDIPETVLYNPKRISSQKVYIQPK